MEPFQNKESEMPLSSFRGDFYYNSTSQLISYIPVAKNEPFKNKELESPLS